MYKLHSSNDRPQIVFARRVPSPKQHTPQTTHHPPHDHQRQQPIKTNSRRRTGSAEPAPPSSNPLSHRTLTTRRPRIRPFHNEPPIGIDMRWRHARILRHRRDDVSDGGLLFPACRFQNFIGSCAGERGGRAGKVGAALTIPRRRVRHYYRRILS